MYFHMSAEKWTEHEMLLLDVRRILLYTEKTIIFGETAPGSDLRSTETN